MSLTNGVSSPSNYIILYAPYTGGPVGMVQPGSVASTAVNVTANVWQHACGTINAAGTLRTAYLNGTSKGTNGSTVAFGTINQTFVASDAFGFYIDGQVTDAAIWNAELDDAEVASLATGNCDPRDIRRGSLSAYWKLPGLYAPEPDYRGLYNLTVTGATQYDDPALVKQIRLRKRLMSTTRTFGVSPAAVAGTFNAAWLSCNKLLGGGIC